jgi:hypothetical protein
MGRKESVRSSGLHLVTCTCAAWSSFKDEITKNKELQEADIILAQEHKLFGDRIVDAKYRLKNRGWRWRLGS